MAIASLQETWLTYQTRKNDLLQELSCLQDQKTLSLSTTADKQMEKAAAEREQRSIFKEIYANDDELQERYLDYTEIPDFEEEIAKIAAQYQNELAEITAWETVIDNQITAITTELEEIEVFMESNKEKLSANIQEDFDFGVN